MRISKNELMLRIISLEDDYNILEERIYELELKIKKLEKPVMKKTTKKTVKK